MDVLGDRASSQQLVAAVKRAIEETSCIQLVVLPVFLCVCDSSVGSLHLLGGLGCPVEDLAWLTGSGLSSARTR